jgi:hypothetical protein
VPEEIGSRQRSPGKSRCVWDFQEFLGAKVQSNYLACKGSLDSGKRQAVEKKIFIARTQESSFPAIRERSKTFLGTPLCLSG